MKKETNKQQRFSVGSNGETEVFLNGLPIIEAESNLLEAREFLPDLLITIRQNQLTVSQIESVIEEMIASGREASQVIQLRS